MKCEYEECKTKEDEVPAKVEDYSKKNYSGKVYCFSCQMKARKNTGQSSSSTSQGQPEEAPVLEEETIQENPKTKAADVFELGMAKNNAAVMLHEASIDTSKYWSLVKRLYDEGRKLRKELLGY